MTTASDPQPVRVPGLRRSELENFEKMLHPDNGFTVQNVMSAWLSLMKSTVPIIEDTPAQEPKKVVQRTPANPRSKKSMRKALKEARLLIALLAKCMYAAESELCPNVWTADAGKETQPCEGHGECTRNCDLHGSGKLFSRLGHWNKHHAVKGKRIT